VDLSNTAGIIPVKIENRMYINDTLTFLHYSNISYIQAEIHNLGKSIENFKNKSPIAAMLDPIAQLHENLLEKLSLLFPNPASSREKRGLFNGLGNAISWVTGNMNADDKEHYEKIINELEYNERKLFEKEQSSLAISNHLVDKFNADVTRINQNNELIKAANLAETNMLDELQLISLISLNLELLEIKINTLLDSLEFCSYGKMHYSIVHKSDFDIIMKSNRDNIASTNLETLWKLSTVRCAVSENMITYFISIPKKASLLNTYCLLSYPVVLDHSTYTVNVKEEVISVSQSSLVVLDQCLQDQYVSYCRKERHIENSCITDILNNTELMNCQRTNVLNVKPFIKYDEKCNCIYGYKQSQIEINNDKINTPSTFLIHLRQGDQMKDLRLPFSFKSSKSYRLTSIPTKVMNNSLKLNQMIYLNKSSESIQGISFLQESYLDPKYLIIVIAFISILIVYVYFKCCKEQKIIVEPVSIIPPPSICTNLTYVKPKP
jgi:hypothetical protein